MIWGVKMTKISVIMPVYNCEDYLKDSVESILNQSLSDLELVCVDDGSSDNSLEILKEYENQDSRVKVFALNHLGGGDARNFALNQVCGEYLYFIDADDVLSINAFEDFYSISKNNDLDFLMFKAKKYDCVQKKLFEHDYYNMVQLLKFKDKVFNFNDLGDLIFNINVTPWCKFYNTEFVLNSGAKFRSKSKFHDNQFFWDIIFQAERIYFLDEFYYTQFVHSKSLIESAGENHCDVIDVQNNIWELFKKHGQFDKFKMQLYDRKMFLYVMRYDEIKEEFKELFFKKMKQDLNRLRDGDFRDYLAYMRKFVFDSVMISQNHNDFDILKGFYYILKDGPGDVNQKMSQSVEWFNGLSKQHKRFAFNYILEFFKNNELNSENEKFLNKFQYSISIIIPVYNVEDYLDDAFNSILNQTIGFENLEVIFVDDASTDASPQIIKRYSEKYENVISIFLDKNSEYAGRPRNVGMNYVTSDYLMFLDPDDVFLENACEILYNQITSENLEIVCGVHNAGGSVPDWIWINILTDPQENYNIRVKKTEEILKNMNFELNISSVDEWPSVCAATNILDKIFKKSLIVNNGIAFPEGIPAEDSLFLLNALLNANGIKFINDVIVNHDYKRADSVQHQFSKTKIIRRLKAYFEMFYLCMDKNKTDIFKHYLLVTKLRHVLVDHIMNCKLPSNEILEILQYAKPLFKLYVDYGGSIPENLVVFRDIASGDFENAMKFIQGENTPKLSDIKCIASANSSVGGCIDLSDNWLNQFETLEPDLFVFDDQNRNEEILNYCADNNIQSVQLDNLSDNLMNILDSINFKYIPDLKHLVLIYRLDDLKNLNDIINHFHSITYPFKHLKMITTEENLFLNNTILASDLSNLDYGDNYYYCFADLDFEFDENDFNHDYLQKNIFLNKINLLENEKGNTQNGAAIKVENLSDEELSQLTSEELRNYYIYQFVPHRVRIEASTICQLKCAGCGFQKGEGDDLGRGYLTFENFKKFCEMNPFIKEIELSNYGEMFLNPELVDMMYYAKEKGINLICYNGANFNTVTDEQIHALVDTGFKAIVLSIDGASQESYSQYRIGGNFDKVMENVKKVQNLKKKTGSKFPELKWQYILMEHNELEIGKAKEMAAELGIPISFKYNWDENYEPVHREYIMKETGKTQLTEAEFAAVHEVSPFNGLCEQIFIRPQINWDGRMLACCTRRYATFDINVFEVGLIEAIRSPKYIEAKECLMTVHPDKEKYGSCTCWDCPTRKKRENAGLAFKL